MYTRWGGGGGGGGYMSVLVNVSKFGHWVCGESWYATKDLQPTAPVLKAGYSVSYYY